MEQLAFFALRARRAPVPPKRRRVVKLKAADLQHGKRITIRLGAAEAKQLVAVALEVGCSVSEVIRDSLYEAHRIGELVGPDD